MERTFEARVKLQNSGRGTERAPCEALVLIVGDNFGLASTFRAVCEHVNVSVERIPTNGDLGSALCQRHPMAVVAEIDAAGQDGRRILMTVAAHDRDLPVLLVSGDDPAIHGAIDAVEEVWRLSSVVRWPRLLDIGAILNFVFRAGRKGDCMRLMST